MIDLDVFNFALVLSTDWRVHEWINWSQIKIFIAQNISKLTERNFYQN